jgi:hypothetical protein
MLGFTVTCNAVLEGRSAKRICELHGNFQKMGYQDMVISERSDKLFRMVVITWDRIEPTA